MSGLEAAANHEKEEVFASLSMPTDAERLAFDEQVSKLGIPKDQTDLFRFNLNIRGIAKLVQDGAAHLHDADHGTSVRGYLIRMPDRKLTVFWPGGLTIHNAMAPLLRDVFPNAPLDATDKYKLLAKGEGHTFPDAEIKEFNDVITADARN